MKTVVAIHTAMPMVEPTKALFDKHLPDVRLINIVDDSLIQDVIQQGEVPEPVRKRLKNYYRAAIDAGADLIFNTCSSVGDLALEEKKQLEVPLIKIDDAMALEAVRISSSIGVLATLSTTLAPTVRLIEKFAKEAEKKVTITEGLAEGAFQAALEGNRALHDQLIVEAAQKIASQVELFVLAQGSMARMEKNLYEVTGRRVLSSPERGVLQVKEELALNE